MTARKIKDGWFVRFTLEGRRYQYSLQTKSKVIAQSKLIKMRQMPLQELFVYLDDGVKTDGLTKEQLVEMYQHFCENNLKAPQSGKTINQNVNSFLRIAQPVSKVEDFTPLLIRSFGATYAGNTNSLCCVYRSAASLFSKKALIHYNDRFKQELTNPFLLVDYPATRIDPYRPMTTIARNKLIDDANNELDNTQLSLFMLALYFGCRRGEASEARRDWLTIYDDRAILHISRTNDWQPKSHEERQIPVPIHRAQKLLDLNSGQDYLVDYEGKSKETRIAQPWENLNRWMRSKGITDDKPLHKMRKEFGSVIATRHGITQASRLLGHSSITTSMRHYANLVELPTVDF